MHTTQLAEWSMKEQEEVAVFESLAHRDYIACLSLRDILLNEMQRRCVQFSRG
jgi:hypothetical protein